MNHFYSKRFKDEEDRANTQSFLELEAECDEHNATVIEYMNRDHLTKTKSKEIDTAVKRWRKGTATLLKKCNPKSTSFLGYHSLATKRTWLL